MKGRNERKGGRGGRGRMEEKKKKKGMETRKRRKGAKKGREGRKGMERKEEKEERKGRKERKEGKDLQSFEFIQISLCQPPRKGSFRGETFQLDRHVSFLKCFLKGCHTTFDASQNQGKLFKGALWRLSKHFRLVVNRLNK